jgi:peptide/nickel transport system substrate-binding protein
MVHWLNDEIDVAQWLGAIREQIRMRTPEAFVMMPYPTNFYYMMNASIPPMDDINVRKALCHAVDWDEAMHAAWEASRDDRVMKTILTPELECFKADNWPDWGFDPEKARQELAASKYGGPEDLPMIRISTGGTTATYVRTAEIMLEQWRNNLGIENAEMKVGWGDAWGQEADLINCSRMSAGSILPDGPSFLASHFGGRFTEENGYVDEELERMIAELMGTARDAPDFCEKMQAAEARYLGHYPYMGMVWERYEYSIKPWVKNFETNIDNNFKSLLDVYIEAH